jgi:hypothetical protein
LTPSPSARPALASYRRGAATGIATRNGSAGHEWPARIVSDDLTRLDIAFHAVLHRFGLVDVEDRATLMVAKRIVDLAAQGELDPERLTATTVQTLSK